nr:hypothetical protein F52B5.4 - Caenorhabditis elegans [Caenorhabditis elegans]
MAPKTNFFKGRRVSFTDGSRNEIMEYGITHLNLKRRMEPDDSQLSDILKDARIPDSQDIGVNLTQNLSFDTVQKMIDGVFTPIFSQGTEDSLEKDILKTPGISTIYNGILGNGEETKKRTPKISDAFEPDLNTSGDVFDSDKSEDGLMNDESYLSNTTLSQVVLDSQKYEYLRVRTEEEQQLVIEKRARERFIRKSMKIAEETALSYENDGSRELSETMTQKVTQMDFTETNVPFDGNDE